MIEQLVHALQALAAPADVQVARHPAGTVAAEELALDFDDAWRLVTSCQQLELAPAQRAALASVDAALSRMGGTAQARLRTPDALRAAPEWALVREHAARALAALGRPVEPPPPARATYLPDPQS